MFPHTHWSSNLTTALRLPLKVLTKQAVKMILSGKHICKPFSVYQKVTRSHCWVWRNAFWIRYLWSADWKSCLLHGSNDACLCPRAPSAGQEGAAAPREAVSGVSDGERHPGRSVQLAGVWDHTRPDTHHRISVLLGQSLQQPCEQVSRLTHLSNAKSGSCKFEGFITVMEDVYQFYLAL